MLALTLLLGLPAAAQGNNDGGAAGERAAEAPDKGQDRVAAMAAKLRERAAKFEAKGDTKSAGALRRRADRLEQRKKGHDEKFRKSREKRAAEGEKPAKDEAKKGG
jgi:hypothetical protein